MPAQEQQPPGSQQQTQQSMQPTQQRQAPSSARPRAQAAAAAPTPQPRPAASARTPRAQAAHLAGMMIAAALALSTTPGPPSDSLGPAPRPTSEGAFARGQTGLGRALAAVEAAGSKTRQQRAQDAGLIGQQGIELTTAQLAEALNIRAGEGASRNAQWDSRVRQIDALLAQAEGRGPARARAGEKNEQGQARGKNLAPWELARQLGFLQVQCRATPEDIARHVGVQTDDLALSSADNKIRRQASNILRQRVNRELKNIQREQHEHEKLVQLLEQCTGKLQDEAGQAQRAERVRQGAERRPRPRPLVLGSDRYPSDSSAAPEQDGGPQHGGGRGSDGEGGSSSGDDLEGRASPHGAFVSESEAAARQFKLAHMARFDQFQAPYKFDPQLPDAPQGLGLIRCINCRSKKLFDRRHLFTPRCGFVPADKGSPPHIGNMVCKGCESVANRMFWGPDNNMVPSEVPEELQHLSLLEAQIIARITPLIAIEVLGGGVLGKRKGSNCIALAQRNAQLFTDMPRLPEEVKHVWVRTHGSRSSSPSHSIKRARVEAALRWLQSHNPFYSDIRILPERLARLPEDGSLHDFVQDKDIIEVPAPPPPQPGSTDAGPAPRQLGDAEDEMEVIGVLGDEEESEDPEAAAAKLRRALGLPPEESSNDSDTGGHLSPRGPAPPPGTPGTPPAAPDPPTPPTDKRPPPVGSQKHRPFEISRGDKINERTPGYWSMAYPRLFPDGKGDFNMPRLVGADESKHFNKWTERMLLFEDGRFAVHPHFKFIAVNIQQRRAATKTGTFMSQRGGAALPATVGELRKNPHLLRSAVSFGENLRGTDNYWHARYQEILSLLQFKVWKGEGPPSFFWTGSCAEFHHPSLLALLSQYHFEATGEQLDTLDPANRTQTAVLVKNYSHVVVQWFEVRTSLLIEQVIKPVFGVTDTWHRFEFAKSRGQIHFHMLCWRADMRPHGLAGKMATEGGKDAADVWEQKVGEWFEAAGFTAKHPAGSHGDDLSGVLGDADEPERAGQPRTHLWEMEGNCFDEHPLFRTFQSVLQPDTRPQWRQRVSPQHSVDVINKIGIHECSAYCLRAPKGRAKRAQKGKRRPVVQSDKDDRECRSGFGCACDMAPSGNGRFLLGKKKDTDKFYIRRDPRGYIIGECPRDHPRVVQRLRDLAETWGANTEVTVIVTASDPEKPDLAELDKIARYLAGYACKNSDSVGAVMEMYLGVAESLDESTPTRDLCSKLLVKSVGMRDISAPAANYDLLSLPLWRCSQGSGMAQRQFETIPLTRGRMLDTLNAEDAEDAEDAERPAAARKKQKVDPKEQKAFRDNKVDKFFERVRKQLEKGVPPTSYGGPADDGGDGAGSGSEDDQPREEDGAGGLIQPVRGTKCRHCHLGCVDARHQTATRPQSVRCQFCGLDTETPIRVRNLTEVSLYEFLSVQKGVIGAKVPVPKGSLRWAAWPLPADYCRATCMQHMRARDVIDHIDHDKNGDDVDWEGLLLELIQQDHCPWFVRGDVERVRAKAERKTEREEAGDADSASTASYSTGLAYSDNEEGAKLGEDEEALNQHYHAAGGGGAEEDAEDDIQLRHCEGWDELAVNIDAALTPPSQAWTWLNEQLDTVAKNTEGQRREQPQITPEDIERLNSLNERQRQAVEVVVEHVVQFSKAKAAMQPGDEPPKQLKMIVTGTAGSGKSWVLGAIRTLVAFHYNDKRAVDVVAPSGTAAFGADGTTLHSRLKVPADKRQFYAKIMEPPHKKTIEALELKKLQVLLVDEYSMVGHMMLGWMDHCLRYGRGELEQEFGGLAAIVLFGDPGQLPPVGDRRLWSPLESDPKKLRAAAVKGHMLFKRFTHCIYLTDVQRQKPLPCNACPGFHEDGAQCTRLKDLLLALRFGGVTEEHWKWLCGTREQRHMTEQQTATLAQAGMCLFPRNADVAAENCSKLQLVINEGAKACLCRAQNNGKCAKRGEAKFERTAAKKGGRGSKPGKFGGVPPQVYIAEGAKVALTMNLCVRWGLFNGAPGVVKAIYYRTGREPTPDGNNHPDLLLVDFPSYKGTAWLPSHPTIVPIGAVVGEQFRCCDRIKSPCSRTGLPLQLCFACSIHKSQGMTVGNTRNTKIVVLELGGKDVESWAPGAGFVGLSRAEGAENLVLNSSVSLDRLTSVVTSAGFRELRAEDARLHALCDRTITEFTPSGAVRALTRRAGFLDALQCQTEHGQQPPCACPKLGAQWCSGESV